MGFLEIEEPDMSQWRFDDYLVFTFTHERHMYEFMAYRDCDSFGPSKLFLNKFEVVVLKENMRFCG